MTPAEWATHVEAHYWRQDQADRRDIGMLWLAEHFSRQKKLKTLEEILDPVVATVLAPEEALRQQHMQEKVADAMKSRRARGITPRQKPAGRG